MSTMVVRLDCDPQHRDDVARHLREDVVVWAQEQLGFAGGSWHMSQDGRQGIGVVEFASSAAAEAAALGPRRYHDPDVPFRIASVDIYETIATASRPSQVSP